MKTGGNTSTQLPLLALDTEAHDVRDPAVITNIVVDLQTYFSPPPQDQTVLFGFDGAPPTSPLIETKERPRLRFLQRLNSVEPRQPVEFRASSAAGFLERPLSRPAVYLAAPFTAVAVPPAEPAETFPPGDDRSHGVIPHRYRSELEAIAAVFEHESVQVVLPHRDVNSWGARLLTPEQVAQGCLELVRDCDAFVGILGESFGAHTEAGMALASGKPCTIVEVTTLGHTFVGGGLGLIPGARSITAQTLHDVPAALQQAGIENFNPVNY